MINYNRIVRVGVIQHQIVLPTSAPIIEQRNAIYKKIGKIISLAAEANVNILCLQEAWRKTV